MPLYEYKCKKCNTPFEFLAKNSEDSPSKCPECGSKRTEKLLSTFSAYTPNAVPAGCAAEAGSSCSTGACPTGSCPYA